MRRSTGVRSDVGRLAAGGYRVLRAVGYRVRRRMVTTVVSAAPDRPAVRRLIPATLQQLADSAPDLALTTHRARYVVERRQADVTVWQLAARTSDAVTEVLERAGVAFFATHLPLTRVAHWAVPRDQLAQAVRAISRELGPEAFYLQLDQHTTRPRLAQEGLTPEELASVERLTVFQHVRCTTTGELHGAPDGCQIAVRGAVPDGDLAPVAVRGAVPDGDRAPVWRTARCPRRVPDRRLGPLPGPCHPGGARPGHGAGGGRRHPPAPDRPRALGRRPRARAGRRDRGRAGARLPDRRRLPAGGRLRPRLARAARRGTPRAGRPGRTG